MRTLLIVLPYAGLVLSTFSAIWALTHELTTKDENNKRHLTRAGRYSMVLILLGLFISFNTGVLKTITDNQDKNAAKQAADLEKLTRQQQEEANEQRARTTQDKLDREAQAGRDRELSEQQRDLIQSQQQIQGFNKAERLARLRTLAELQRSNHILWDIRRSQYPFTTQFEMQPVVRVSIDHPVLRPFAEQIRSEAKKKGNLDPIPVYEDSHLFSDSHGLPSILKYVDLNVSICRSASNVASGEPEPCIEFIYFADVFVKRQATEKQGPTIFSGTMSYSVARHSYRIAAPRIASPTFSFKSSGKLTSLLDLPGGKLVIGCRRVETRTGCKDISLESLLFEFPPGIRIEIRAFDHETVGGEDRLIHRFDSDKQRFFERYAPR